MAREILFELGKMITDRLPYKFGVKKLTEEDPEYILLDRSLESDEQAEIMLKMGLRKPKTLEEIARITGKDPKHVEELLEKAAATGAIEYHRENPRREKLYYVQLFVPGIAEMTNMVRWQFDKYPELGEPDEKGRRKPVGTGEFETLKVSSVLSAVGQVIDWGELDVGALKTGKKGNAVADAITYQTEQEDIFVGGDVYTGPKFAIDAIAAGREGAESLHRFVQEGQSLTISRNLREFYELDKENILVSPDCFDTPARQPILRDAKKAKTFQHDRLTFTEEQVKAETSRCLGCGVSVVDRNKCIDCGQTTCAMEEKRTAAQLDPALIPELERMWNRNPGSVTMEQLAGSLRKAGADHVLSSECAARCAAAKAEALLEERLGAGEPLILSNDPDVWKFLWENYRQLAPRFAFYPPELELFGERARTVLGAELVLAFVSVGSAAAEAEESSDVDAVVDARGLYRILVCCDAAPSAECTAAVECFPAPAVSGKYGRLLEPLAKNNDAGFEPVTVTADSRELRCALCHNLGQARRAIEAGGFDVIRVIS